MNHDMNALTARLERLERSHRRWRGAGLIAMLGVATLGLAAAAPAVCDIVYGERLVLRDEGGRTRVTIDAYRTDTPSLAFQDRDGRVRARLGLDKDGQAFVSVYDAKGALTNTQRFDGQPATHGGEEGPRKAPAKPAGDPSIALR